MKNRRNNLLKQFGACVWENLLEWKEFIRNTFFRRKNGESNLVEVYSIKAEIFNEEYIKDFIKEREKLANINKYKIKTDCTFASANSNEIGKVTLYCRERYIDHAILTKGPLTGDKSRIIYWNFENKEKV